MGFAQEFKEFAIKGNAIDMAVGIIIGAAFNKVVNSIVNDIIMPPLGMIIGGMNFQSLRVILKEGVPPSEGVPEVAEVAIRYGMLITTLVDFLIVALTIFVVIRVMRSTIAARTKAV